MKPTPSYNDLYEIVRNRERSLKFIYIDETGLDENTDVFIMVGLLIDAYSLRATTKQCDAIIGGFIRGHNGKIQEVRAKTLFKSKGSWKNIDTSSKEKYLSDVIEFVVKNTKIYSIVISKKLFGEKHAALPKNIDNNYWLISAQYICGLVQKKMSKLKKNKGNTVMVFDNNAKDVPKISEALYVPNSWFDDLYIKKEKKKENVNSHERFSQIINTAFSIKSEHSFIIQAADTVCHIMRRYLELKENKVKEKWKGEKCLITKLANDIILANVKLGQSSKGSQCIQYYKSITYPGWEL